MKPIQPPPPPHAMGEITRVAHNPQLLGGGGRSKRQILAGTGGRDLKSNGLSITRYTNRTYHCTCHANSVIHAPQKWALGCKEGWSPGNTCVIGES